MVSGPFPETELAFGFMTSVLAARVRPGETLSGKVPGAGGDAPAPQAASQSKPRTAPGTDFLKPVMGSSFPSRAKRDVFKILLIRKFGWGCRISARAKAQNEVPGQSHVARKRCGGGSHSSPRPKATPLA